MGMTKGERMELGALIRKREKVMRAQAEERSAALLAEFEAQSSKEFAWDEDPVWEQAFTAVRQAIDEGNREIDKRCEQLGIPKEFRPAILSTWIGRRENGVKQRQDELRRTAKAKIEALERAAISKIEKLSLGAQTEIIASGLESEAAQTFLKSMPAMDVLMPPIQLDEIQSLLQSEREKQGRRPALGYLGAFDA